jgi:hypothetical protein
VSSMAQGLSLVKGDFPLDLGWSMGGLVPQGLGLGPLSL